MGSEYFYSHNGEQFGPVTSRHLKTLAESGQLQPSDLIWKEGMPAWVEVRSVTRLLTLLPRSSSQPPPLPVPRTKPAANIAVATDLTEATEANPFDFKSITDQGRVLGNAVLRKASTMGAPLHTGLGSARSYLENPILIAGLLTLCFPLGVLLLSLHRQWSRRRKTLWVGAWVCGFGAMVAIGQVKQRELRSAIAQADALWRDGNHLEAVDRYRLLITDPYSSLVDDAAMTLLIRRVVETDIQYGNVDGATAILNKALEDQRNVLLESAAAIDLLAKVRLERVRSTLSHDAAFSDDEKAEILADRNLILVYDMGHLESSKLANYLRMKRALRKQDLFRGTFEYMQLLTLVPSAKWFEVAHRRGLTRLEFQQTTRLLMSAATGELVIDDDVYEPKLLELTGKHLSDY